MRALIVPLLGLGLFCVVSSDAYPCTTFCLQNKKGAVIAKSYDWDFGEGRLFVNKSGVAKQALVLEGSPETWTSQFASLTFNQFGREFPNGGVNEAGLVVEVMMLPGSQFPPADKRKTVNELQWIQYQLDRFATVKDVLANADKIRISPISSAGTVHYLLCDKTGACAALEYLDGQLKETSGKELTAPVLTNSTYENSRDYLRKHKGFGGTTAVPTDLSSLSRFVIAAEATRGSNRNPTAAAWATLDKVRSDTHTQWNIVYDTGAMRVHFRSLGHPAVKSIDLSVFFEASQRTCKTPVKGLDLNTDAEGDVTDRFADYVTADNLELVKSTLGRIQGMPQTLIAMAAAYPSTLPCTLK